MLNFVLGNDFIMNYVLGTVITAGIVYGSALATKHLGLQIDEKRKQDLHSGLMTAARALIARFGEGDLSVVPSKITGEMVGKVVSDAKLSVPQAMKHFDADGKGLPAVSNIATSKILEAVNEVKAAAVSADPRHVTNRT